VSFLTFTLLLVFPVPLEGVSKRLCGFKLLPKVDTQLHKFNRYACGGPAFQEVAKNLPDNAK